VGDLIIDSGTLKSLICGAVSEAMQPYSEELAKQNDRILVLETINQRDKGLCPQNCPCQVKLSEHATQITQTTASVKSAHHRIDGVFKTAALVGGTISGVVTLLLLTLQTFLQWHNIGTKVLGGG